MKIPAGTFPLVLALLSTVSISHAQLSYLWTADNCSNFDLTISGTGSTDPPEGGGLSVEGTVTSPSGLWGLYFAMYGTYEMNGENEYLRFGSRASLTFLRTIVNPWNPDLTLPNPTFNHTGYADHFPMPVQPFQDGNAFDTGVLVDRDYWTGAHVFTFTSIPDAYDTSTWNWTGHFYVNGPALTPVPEPGAIALGLIGLLVGALRFARR